MPMPRLVADQLHRKPATMKADIGGLAGLSNLNRITVRICQPLKPHRKVTKTYLYILFIDVAVLASGMSTVL